MISLDRASYQVQPRYAEYAGLSTDVKPVESIDNGDEFQEIDTGYIYKFDVETSQWIQQPTGGGGGGTSNYNELSNKPSINGVVLEGNKTTEQININIPTSLPNPNKLIFTGASTQEYDGSSEITVNIPNSEVTTSYNDLTDLPQINGVELIGNKTSAELGLANEENWELIIDYVVPETVASLLLEQDLNGEPFSLKKWALLTIWLPDESVSERNRCHIGFLPGAGWGIGVVYESKGAPTNTETAGCTLAFCSFTNGIIKLDDIYLGANFTNVSYSLIRNFQGPNSSGGISLDSTSKEIISKAKDSYATCVKISSISSTAVRKGSIIRLWGVRA